MLVEQQIAERRDRAATMKLQVLKRPVSGPHGDYTVKSASGSTYRVAIRGAGLFENYCSCPDFAVNTLGTCKHIEAMLFTLRQAPNGIGERKVSNAPAPPSRFSMGIRSRFGCTCPAHHRPLYDRSQPSFSMTLDCCAANSPALWRGLRGAPKRGRPGSHLQRCS